MNSIRGRVGRTAVVVAAVLILMTIILCGTALLYTSRREVIRARCDAPLVIVTEPDSGLSVPAGDHVIVGTSALGANPVTRADLWLDGELVETQNSERPEGMSPLYAHFDLVVPEGPHLLMVRATNSAGVTGQSLPVSIVGGPTVEPQPAFLPVTVQEGQSLEDIAATYDTDPITLRYMNPDLISQQLSPGDQVIVPAPPTTVPPPPSEAPAGSGSVPPTTVAPVVPSLPPTPSATGQASSPIPMPSTPPLQAAPAAYPPVGSGWLAGITSSKPPSAPTNLQAQVTQCKVQLQWNDNASGESGYEVWIAGQKLSPRRVASLQPVSSSPAWYEFPAPQPGTFNVWVEAINAVGSQPSNIAAVQVESSCPSTLPPQLQMEFLDATSRGAEDHVYCYVSFEGAPEVRIPTDKSSFIQVSAGQGDDATRTGGTQRIAVPIPKDGPLDLTGECLAWSEEKLDELGTFSGSASADQWDGTRLVLTGDGYGIGYEVTKTGEDGDLTTYDSEDPTLASPYDLKMISLDFPLPWIPSKRILVWSWDGKESISGFVVYLNGKPYRMVYDPSERSLEVNMQLCGAKYRWQVAAVSGTTYSRPSAEYVHTTEECPVLVDVQFASLEVICAENYWIHWTCSNNCKTIETWFNVWVNDKRVQRGSRQFPLKVTCGVYNLTELYRFGGPDWSTVRVPLSGTNPSLKISSTFYRMNRWGERVTFQDDTKTITMPLEQWKTYKTQFAMEIKRNGVWSKLTVKVKAAGTGDIL